MAQSCVVQCDFTNKETWNKYKNWNIKQSYPLKNDLIPKQLLMYTAGPGKQPEVMLASGNHFFLMLCGALATQMGLLGTVPTISLEQNIVSSLWHGQFGGLETAGTNFAHSWFLKCLKRSLTLSTHHPKEFIRSDHIAIHEAPSLNHRSPITF